MSPIRIGIGHNYNFIVVNIFNIKFISYTAANRINDCINLFIFKDISKLCFSVLITLPRNGNTVWKRRSRPCFAEPPAESPSTRYSSFFAGYVIVQVLISLNVPSDFSFLTTASSLALRAASRACAALIAFLTRSVATSGFLLKSMLNAQIQWHQLKNALHLYLVCPSFALQTEALLLVHVPKR